MIAYLEFINSTSEKYIVEDFTLISDRNHELKNVYTIVLEDCAIQKQCAILKLENQYKIIDMCSFKTSLKRKLEENYSILSPLKFYELLDGDQIKIGFNEYVFKTTKKCSILLVPDSQEIIDTSNISSNASQHLELPETQNEDYSQEILLNDLLTANDFENNLLNEFDCKQEIEEYSDDMRLDSTITREIVNEEIKLKQAGSKNDTKPNFVKSEKLIEKENEMNYETNENEIVQDIDFLLETQPCYRLPRATRFQKRKQEMLKPKTRPVHLLDATQDILASYGQETQPFVPIQMKVSQKPKRMKIERNLEFEREYIIRSQAKPKVNPLLLSDEEDNDDDFSFTSFLKRKSATSQSKSDTATDMSIIDEVLPEIPSQILNNSDIVSKINESQNHQSQQFLDLDEEETKPEPVKRFFGNILATQQRKKLLRYASSDDD